MPLNAKRTSQPAYEPKTTRVSVSFPRELYETLESIAKEKKVSVAWIVRDAAEKYVGDQ
jgi:metal-responsive CopG/Arc/MetJ family transcriptional regulator